MLEQFAQFSEIHVIVVIITIYFENVAFFHAKLGFDVCPGVNYFWCHFAKDNVTIGEPVTIR